MIAEVALREAASDISCVFGNDLTAVDEHVRTLVGFSSLPAADIDDETLQAHQTKATSIDVHEY